MGSVVKTDFTLCMGIPKDRFRAVYFELKPAATDEDFERDWLQLELDKAKHIAELNGASNG